VDPIPLWLVARKKVNLSTDRKRRPLLYQWVKVVEGILLIKIVKTENLISAMTS
jgi:hypothetical protein